MYDLDENTVLWKDGYGPKNHVHGGIISFPIFGKDNIQLSNILINYRRPIPLQSYSKIIIEEDKFKICDNINNIQADGKFILK